MSGFARRLRGELRKLANPVVVLLLAVLISFLWQDIARTTYLANGQATAAVVAQLGNKADASKACAAGASGACTLSRNNVKANHYFVQNSLELGRIGRSLGTLPGLVTFVAHQLTTGMGWLFVALLGAFHVTGEESRGTVSGAVLAMGRRTYWLAKAVSVCLATLVALVVAVTVLFALRFTYAIHPSVPSAVRPGPRAQPEMIGVHRLTPDPTWSSWPHALGAVGHAIAVLAVVSTVICSIVVWLRRVTRAAALGAAVVAGFFALAQWAHLGALGPEGGLSRLLRLDRVPYGVIDARLWDLTGRPADIIDRPFGAPVLVRQLGAQSQSAPDPYAGLLVWGLVAVVVTAVLVHRYAKRDVAG